MPTARGIEWAKRLSFQPIPRAAPPGCWRWPADLSRRHPLRRQRRTRQLEGVGAACVFRDLIWYQLDLADPKTPSVWQHLSPPGGWRRRQTLRSRIVLQLPCASPLRDTCPLLSDKPGLLGCYIRLARASCRLGGGESPERLLWRAPRRRSPQARGPAAISPHLWGQDRKPDRRGPSRRLRRARPLRRRV